MRTTTTAAVLSGALTIRSSCARFRRAKNSWHVSFLHFHVHIFTATAASMTLILAECFAMLTTGHHLRRVLDRPFTACGPSQRRSRAPAACDANDRVAVERGKSSAADGPRASLEPGRAPRVQAARDGAWRRKALRERGDQETAKHGRAHARRPPRDVRRRRPRRGRRRGLEQDGPSIFRKRPTASD